MKRFILLLLLLHPCIAWTQGLTEAQYQLLKTDITVTNQAEFSAAVAANDDQFIADAYNKLKEPTFWVWKSVLLEQEIYESTSSDASAATWNWSTYKAQTVQDRDSWALMLRSGKINPSLKQTRDAFPIIFGGQGASATQNAFLLAISRRPARRVEALLILSNLGNGSTTTPANMGYEGTISRLDVAHALRGVPIS